MGLFMCGLLYVNLLEWFIHKHILHGLGSKKKSFWSFHWHRHHRTCRQSNFSDEDYSQPMKWGTTGKEVFGLCLLVLIHLPVLLLSVPLFLGMTSGAALYYVLHKKAHKDPSWGRAWLPWHYDHHMGRNQNKNWCVTYPFWDYVFGTRKKFKYDKKGRLDDVQ